MKTLYLLRHGEYENPRQILPTRLPGFPLSDIGRRQIQKAALYLKDKHISAIYSSPLLRTKQTARIVGKELGLPVRFSRSLLELQSPVQGMNLSITEEIDRCGDTYHFPLHYRNGGETAEHLYRRMKRITGRIIRESKENALVVSHGDPLMVFFIREQGKLLDREHAILQYGPYLPKAGLMRFDYEGEKLQRAHVVNY